jgi:hypothetical protein
MKGTGLGSTSIGAASLHICKCIRGGGPRGDLELENTRAREKLAFLHGVRKMLRDDEDGERCDLATCKN